MNYTVYTKIKGKNGKTREITVDDAQQSDKIGNFINECLEECQGGGCTAKEAYEAYKSWCSECGYFVECKQKLMELIRGKNLLYPTATLNGKTAFNVIKDYLVTHT